MGKTRSGYRKQRKFYGNQFHRNKSLSEEAVLEDESCMQSTVSSADIIDEVVRLSDAAGPPVSAKKIKLDCLIPKATKERE